MEESTLLTIADGLHETEEEKRERKRRQAALISGTDFPPSDPEMVNQALQSVAPKAQAVAAVVQRDCLNEAVQQAVTRNIDLVAKVGSGSAGTDLVAVSPEATSSTVAELAGAMADHRTRAEFVNPNGSPIIIDALAAQVRQEVAQSAQGKAAEEVRVALLKAEEERRKEDERLVSEAVQRGEPPPVTRASTVALNLTPQQQVQREGQGAHDGQVNMFGVERTTSSTLAFGAAPARTGLFESLETSQQMVELRRKQKEQDEELAFSA